VHWRKDLCRWEAAISKNRKLENPGHFRSEVAAAKAYDQPAVDELFGEFGKTNPECDDI
jgi:hypothetical protein